MRISHFETKHAPGNTHGHLLPEFTSSHTKCFWILEVNRKEIHMNLRRAIVQTCVSCFSDTGPVGRSTTPTSGKHPRPPRSVQHSVSCVTEAHALTSGCSRTGVSAGTSQQSRRTFRVSHLTEARVHKPSASAVSRRKDTRVGLFADHGYRRGNSLVWASNTRVSFSSCRAGLHEWGCMRSPPAPSSQTACVPGTHQHVCAALSAR